MKRSGLVHAGFHYNPPMKPQTAILIFVSGLACTPAFGLAAGPAWTHSVQSRPRAVTLADGLSLDEAVARAEKQFNARVVRAEERRRGDRRVYQIRLLSSDGRVFDVTVDAESGRVE